jgi:hypothetical protein
MSAGDVTDMKNLPIPNQMSIQRLRFDSFRVTANGKDCFERAGLMTRREWSKGGVPGSRIKSFEIQLYILENTVKVVQSFLSQKCITRAGLGFVFLLVFRCLPRALYWGWCLIVRPRLSPFHPSLLTRLFLRGAVCLRSPLGLV